MNLNSFLSGHLNGTQLKAKPVQTQYSPSALSDSAQKTLAAKAHALQQQTLRTFSQPSAVTVITTTIEQTIATYPLSPSNPLPSPYPSSVKSVNQAPPSIQPPLILDASSPLKNDPRRVISRQSFIPMLLQEAERLVKQGTAARQQNNDKPFMSSFSDAGILLHGVLDGHLEDLFNFMHCVPLKLQLTLEEHTALLGALKKMRDAQYALDRKQLDSAGWQAWMKRLKLPPTGTASLPAPK